MEQHLAQKKARDTLGAIGLILREIRIHQTV